MSSLRIQILAMPLEEIKELQAQEEVTAFLDSIDFPSPPNHSRQSNSKTKMSDDGGGDDYAG